MIRWGRSTGTGEVEVQVQVKKRLQQIRENDEGNVTVNNDWNMKITQQSSNSTQLNRLQLSPCEKFCVVQVEMLSNGHLYYAPCVHQHIHDGSKTHINQDTSNLSMNQWLSLTHVVMATAVAIVTNIIRMVTKNNTSPAVNNIYTTQHIGT